ncbi:right-handed parallel beta-helix repeat-containing protein [uncultured Methanobrevibacter sp.]|uniref:right-handed parallel beta-helix repeat-containing protein n=1 Tax=uncultured Methanobrevibacter sp. TaxID=253161 RepID=UPI0034416B01
MFFISILILVLSVNIVAAEDTNNTSVDGVSHENVLENIEIDYVQLNTSDMSVFSKGEPYNVTLSYDDGTPVFNKTISFEINGVKYDKLTNNQGVASLNIRLNQGTYVISTSFTDDYGRSLTQQNHVYVSDIKGTVIPENLSNIEIQKIIDSAKAGENIIFAGKNYNDISLTISKNPVNIYSNVKSILNGNSKSPVFTIKSSKASGTLIYNLIIQKGSHGVLIDSANNITLLKNDIVQNGYGVSVNSANKVGIVGNLIFDSTKCAVYLYDSTNTDIYSNCISNNDEGIHFDKFVKYTNISNNQLVYNKNYAINFEGSGPYTTVTFNNISFNENGISVNCEGDKKLFIENNAILDNEVNGVYIGEGYVKSSSSELSGIRNNVVMRNGAFNILGRDSDYKSIKLGPVLADGNHSSGTKVCSKIQAQLLGFNVDQIGNDTLSVSVDGIEADFNVKMSLDGGSTWIYPKFSNGKALIHVSNREGKVVFDYMNSDQKDYSYQLSDYSPYVKPTYPQSPVDPTKPINPPTPSSPTDEDSSSGNGTSTDGRQGQGSATSSVNGGFSDGSLSVAGSNSALVSSSSTSQSSTSASQIGTTSSQTVESTDDPSQSVSKVIDIDEEVVRIAGISILILLIIAVIGLYYRDDIKSMIEKKNGK